MLACLVLASASMGQRNVKRALVGKLGQLNEAAPIYVKPDRRSRIIYKGQAQLYIVLRNLNDNWATLVMENGASGYVEAKYVEALPYEVNVKQSTPRLGPVVASRGNFDRNAIPITGMDTGSKICRSATNYIGTRYVWGGNDLLRGVDCSGFVQQLFRQEGISLPRTAALQSLVGQPIEQIGMLQAGDRLYFADATRTKITHTGISMGNGYFIHSSCGNGGVAIDMLKGKWVRMLAGMRR